MTISPQFLLNVLKIGLSKMDKPFFQSAAPFLPDRLLPCRSRTLRTTKSSTNLDVVGWELSTRLGDLKLDRVVALKMILGGKFASNEEIERFRVEGEAAARLDSPGDDAVIEQRAENDVSGVAASSSQDRATPRPLYTSHQTPQVLCRDRDVEHLPANALSGLCCPVHFPQQQRLKLRDRPPGRRQPSRKDLAGVGKHVADTERSLSGRMPTSVVFSAKSTG